jgi:flagellar motor switch protein FliM
VDLAHVHVTLDQILNMQVGDVIPLDIPEFVTASVDSVPVMECRYGISNGRYALRMEKMLGSASNE